MFVTLFVAVVFLALPAPSDVVVMKSGKVHEGVVLKLDGDELTLQIEGGKILIDRGNLSAIHFNATAADVAKQGGDAADGGRKTSDAGGRPAGKKPAAGKFRERSKKNADIEVSVIGAHIGKIRSSDIFDDNKKSSDDRLQVRFRFRNLTTNDGIEYETPGLFDSAFFRVADEGGTRVKGITLAPGEDLIGALEDGHVINPGKTAEHVEIFKTPSDDFKHLDVSVSLKAFGREGTFTYRITRADLGL